MEEPGVPDAEREVNDFLQNILNEYEAFLDGERATREAERKAEEETDRKTKEEA